mmetsp:Transcript_28601/g.87558  ORF Transcript_28601/g.87558 Transcript_28601/m.87558 type:complete len:246 (-) Transcript_28601:333-1070(-)
MTYPVPSALTSRDETLRLGVFPVRKDVPERTANVIAPPSHAFWTLHDDSAALRAFLAKSFPQLPPETFCDLDSFAAKNAGSFPTCQYSPVAALTIGTTHCFLLGDAAHAFPPDVGQGVNSALEDVLVLGDCLTSATDDPSFKKAVAAFHADRAPNTQALAKIAQCAFPYQYSQGPWLSTKLFFAGFLLRVLTSKLAPSLLAEPVMLGILKGKSYVDIWRHAQRTTFFYRALASVSVVALAWVLAA